MTDEKHDRGSSPETSQFHIGEGDRSVALSPRGIHDLAEMLDVRYRVLRGDPERVAGTDSRRSNILRASKTAA